MSDPKYTLHYWPGIPGRGEFIRLCFEATNTPYTDALEAKSLQSLVLSTGTVGSPPHFAPPILEIHPSARGTKARKISEGQSAGEGEKGGSAFISQTPAILALLGNRLGLVGDVEGEEEETREVRRARVQQVTLSALDVNNEAHDVHHPISVSSYYEEQKDEAKRRAEDFRKNRIPKFFKYFELVLSSNPSKSGLLIGDTLTTADLALFQVVDGLQFAFPRLLASFKQKERYLHIFALHERVANEEKIKKYLESDRRQKYSMGIFRHYEELDGEAE